MHNRRTLYLFACLSRCQLCGINGGDIGIPLQLATRAQESPNRTERQPAQQVRHKTAIVLCGALQFCVRRSLLRIRRNVRACVNGIKRVLCVLSVHRACSRIADCQTPTREMRSYQRELHAQH